MVILSKHLKKKSNKYKDKKYYTIFNITNYLVWNLVLFGWTQSWHPDNAERLFGTLRWSQVISHCTLVLDPSSQLEKILNCSDYDGAFELFFLSCQNPLGLTSSRLAQFIFHICSGLCHRKCLVPITGVWTGWVEGNHWDAEDSEHGCTNCHPGGA